jgi:hypothetical protein
MYTFSADSAGGSAHRLDGKQGKERLNRRSNGIREIEHLKRGDVEFDSSERLFDLSLE